VNYIKEVNAFYDWLETNTLTDSAIVLWHALMHISNRAGWPDEFAVAISTLSTKTGLKKDAIIRARLRLQQAGRIDFKSRPGHLSAVYKIIPFESEKPTQSATQFECVGLSDANRNTNRDAIRAQTATQTAHKPRLLINKTKLNERETEYAREYLLKLYNELGIKGGALGLDKVYSYIGVVDLEVIEMALKAAEKKHVNYFCEVLNGWIAEGKTTAAQINPIPDPPKDRPKTDAKSRGQYIDKELEARRMEIALNQWIASGGDPNDFVYRPDPGG
jgi:hypothetical protein